MAGIFMDDSTNPLQLNTPLGVEMKPKEELSPKADPINLDDIKDEELARIIGKRIDDSHDFFKKEYNLFTRRKKNEMYLFGRQVADKEKRNELKVYEARYLDNALYEIESALKPLAMSRLPDMIVTPGTEKEDQKKTAEDVTKVIDTDIKSRENRVSLGIAFKHLPVYFTGVIKVRWVPERDDFIFEPVHPSYIEVDHTCQTNNADDMQFIAQTLPITLQECKIRFPDKWDDLKAELTLDSVIASSDAVKDAEMATQIKIKEVWFKWQKPVKQDGAEETKEKFKEVWGVLWKYKTVILAKMKNPNFDYEGQEKVYTYLDPEDQSTREEVGQQHVMNMMMTGMPPPNMTREKVFKNYFTAERFPYFFMGYDQWRKIPYDETSRIEQNLLNQDAIDKTGKRILEKEAQRTKHVFSKDGGLEAKHIEAMDLDDNRQDILVEGDVNKVHGQINPEVPTSQEFQSLNEARDRMYQLAGVQASRGEVQSDTATSNQIAREADYTRADDLVEDTINAACEWMAQWSLQMIKLRYSEYHFKRLLGARGSTTFIKLKSDMIDDGMEVMIKASGTDKLKTKNTAMDMAKLQLIDPFNFYRDVGLDDPEGRVQALMLLQTNPQEYLMKYGMGVQDTSTPGLGMALNGQPPQVPGQPPMAPPGAPPAPMAPGAPQVPSPANTGAMPSEPPLVPQGVPQ